MGWVKRWEERITAKDRERRQLDREKASLWRLIPSEPVKGPDNVPVIVFVQESGSEPGWSGDPLGVGAAIDMLWEFVGWLRYRGGFAVGLQAPGYRTKKYRYGSELEALVAVTGVVDLVRTTGASGAGLRKARWFMRGRRR